MKGRKKRGNFNDLLIPLIIVIAILPFVVYLAMYNSGLAEEAWYSDNDILGDIFCYYKSRVFIVISMIAFAVMLIYFLVYKKTEKIMKFMLLLPVYFGLALISSVFSVNTTDSWVGSLYHFESILVLAGYVVILFYSFVFVEKREDFQIIEKALVAGVVVLSVLGILQMFDQDIFDWEWIIRLITPAEWESYALENMEDAFSGNNVYMTLYNPNNAGQYIVMVLPFFLLSAILGKGKVRKIGSAVISAVLIILLWFTYSRGALLAFGLEVIIGLFILGKKQLENWKKYIWKIGFAAVGIVLVFVLLDATQNFKFLHRMIDEKEEISINSIITEDEYIEVQCKEQKVQIAFGDNLDEIAIKCQGKMLELSYQEEEGYFFSETLSWLKVTPLQIEEQQVLILYVDGRKYTFVYENGEYLFYNDAGKLDQLVEIDKVDFKGLEYLGSSRLYIWSRTLPLLKKYILIGSGADTFYRVFPQNDYIGKSIYAGTSARIIEKPHNGFLMVAVQTGVVSLIVLMVFYAIYAKTMVSHITLEKQEGIENLMGMGFFIGSVGYMISSMFYDSSLQCTPMFCVMLGISLATVRKPVVK